MKLHKGLDRYFVGTEDLITDHTLEKSVIDLRNEMVDMSPVIHFWGELIFRYYQHKTHPTFSAFLLDDQDIANQGFRRPEMVAVINRVRDLFLSHQAQSNTAISEI